MRLRKNQRGAAAVEFAIVLPVLVMLVFGIIEFSLALYDKAVITNASREGARAGIVFRYDPNTKTYNPPTEADIRIVVNNYTGNYLKTFGSSTNVTTAINRVDRDGSGDISSGDDLIVMVSYIYDFLVLPNFVTNLTGAINLGARTVMRME